MNNKIDEISTSLESLKDTPKTQHELKLQIEEISASVEELKDTPNVQEALEMLASIEQIKNPQTAVVAFRATCAKNFPSSGSTRKSENPGYRSIDII